MNPDEFVFLHEHTLRWQSVQPLAQDRGHMLQHQAGQDLEVERGLVIMIDSGAGKDLCEKKIWLLWKVLDDNLSGKYII